MPKASRARKTRGSARWGLTAVIVALLLVGGAGTALALTRNRVDQPTAATPTPTPIASSSTPGADDGVDASAGTRTASKPKASPSVTSAAPVAVTANCTYVPAAGGQGSIPTPSAQAKLAAHPHVVVTTNYGVVEADLAAGAAPCTVNSFLTLAHNGFFNGTDCHRLTTDQLYVLQCGDPSGTGQGGPGYQFDDENLPSAAARPAYPRGTLAMANAGPGTNGSQFFMVYKDSQIDPNYSVFGKITKGLDVLDKIAAAGSDNSNGPGDGRPKLEVTISRVG